MRIDPTSNHKVGSRELLKECPDVIDERLSACNVFPGYFRRRAS